MTPDQKKYIITWGPWLDHQLLPCGLTDKNLVESLIIRNLVNSERTISGMDHQNKPDGCPYINGDPMAYSLRGWGRIMADARNIVECTNKYEYSNFAWST